MGGEGGNLRDQEGGMDGWIGGGEGPAAGTLRQQVL